MSLHGFGTRVGPFDSPATRMVPSRSACFTCLEVVTAARQILFVPLYSPAK